jgi:hypothetical protein
VVVVINQRNGRPLVMSNRHYQVAGILPRLAMRMRTDAVFQRLREGLVLAGVPPAAIDGPFSGDGSAGAPAKL